MKKQKPYLCILIFLLISTHTSYAQGVKTPTQLIAGYYQAILSQEETAIDHAWEELHANDKALALMARTKPRLYKSYEYWRIKRELKELKAKRFLNSEFRDLGGESSFSASREVQRSNNRTARDYPNQERRSNRSVALTNPNQNRRPNQDTVNAIPNRELRSNQQRIRSRLRRLR